MPYIPDRALVTLRAFPQVFTTESGLRYTAFKTVLDELLRIADEFIVGLYQKYR